MARVVPSIALLVVFVSAAPLAMAQFVVRAGDSVYVDGHKYPLEEWKKIRDHYQPASSSTPPTAMAAARDSAGANAPRAASCTTSIYYDEFPAEDERFTCTQGLGALTREEILRGGWKVDFIDKLPAPAGKQSARGLPLYQYKLVISR